MKISLQALAVMLILPLCACGTVQRTYADNTFDSIDYLQGVAPDAPIMHVKHSIFGTMNF